MKKLKTLGIGALLYLSSFSVNPSTNYNKNFNTKNLEKITISNTFNQNKYEPVMLASKLPFNLPTIFYLAVSATSSHNHHKRDKTECNDDIDNDKDGYTDMEDSDCISLCDRFEGEPDSTIPLCIAGGLLIISGLGYFVMKKMGIY